MVQGGLKVGSEPRSSGFDLAVDLGFDRPTDRVGASRSRKTGRRDAVSLRPVSFAPDERGCHVAVLMAWAMALAAACFNSS